MANINDLRSALELLQTIDEQYVETDVEVDPNAELSGVYRYVGAGGTVSRPTREGPAMVFNNVKGHPDARVAIGVLASRKRVGYLLDEKPENLGKLLNRAVSNPIPPAVVDASKAQCQEVVHYATEEGFDIRKLIPAPTNTEEDAGPYININSMGPAGGGGKPHALRGGTHRPVETGRPPTARMSRPTKKQAAGLCRAACFVHKTQKTAANCACFFSTSC